MVLMGHCCDGLVAMVLMGHCCDGLVAMVLMGHCCDGLVATVLMGHCCDGLVATVLMGHCCDGLVAMVLMGHCCDGLVAMVLMGHCCDGLVAMVLMGHCCDGLVAIVLMGHCCDGLVAMVLMGHSCDGLVAMVLMVNDIPNVVTSTIKLFADDTKIYCELNNVRDTFALQSDLDSLENWTKSWQVNFNSDKCEVMRITLKQDKSIPSYYLSNTELRFVDLYKDLGVNMSRDLSWSNHVGVIVNKANKVLGLLKRTVSSKNKEIFSTLYKSLVRPILACACPVWSPHLVKDILAIEKEQRRTSRIALGQKPCEMPYEERCKSLNWNSLQHRREYLSLVECYKTVFGLNGLDFNFYFSECCKSKSTKLKHESVQVKTCCG